MSQAVCFVRSAPRTPVPTSATSATRWGRTQDLLIRVFDMFGNWHDRTLDRRRLASLDDRILHDIGVDRAAAANEALKPFWRD